MHKLTPLHSVGFHCIANQMRETD